MGIDVQTFARRPPRHLFWRADDRSLLIGIDAAAKSWAASRGLQQFYRSTVVSDRSLAISIVPVADSISIDVSHAGIGVGFRSSNYGPGYHAAVIDMLDDVARTRRLTWDWGQSADSSFDETSYTLTRDFAALQQEHADFLKSLMDASLERGIDDPAICIPWGLGLDDGGLSCPLGLMSSSWRLAVSEADGPDLAQLARDFFPWWDREIGATFWQNLTRALLWQQVEWRRPVAEHETRALDMLNAAAARLRELAGAVPGDLAAAMEELDAAVRTNVPPAAVGIGYRKRSVVREVYDHWSIKLPGPFVEEISEDGESVRFSGGNTTLWISALSAVGVEGKPYNWPESLKDRPQWQRNGLMRRTEPPQAATDGVTQFAMVVSQKGPALRLLMLTLHAPDEAGLSPFENWLDSINMDEEWQTIRAEGASSNP